MESAINFVTNSPEKLLKERSYIFFTRNLQTQCSFCQKIKHQLQTVNCNVKFYPNYANRTAIFKLPSFQGYNENRRLRLNSEYMRMLVQYINEVNEYPSHI